MKFLTWGLFTVFISTPVVAAPIAIGPSIDFLTIPHPLSLSLNAKSPKYPITGYITIGSFRTLYQDDFPIRMRNASIGANYHFSQGWFLGLELGHQRMEIIDGNGGSLANTFLTPKIGYEFTFINSGWFIRPEVGVQYNFTSHESASGAEAKALERCGDDTTAHFSLLRVGYYFK